MEPSWVQDKRKRNHDDDGDQVEREQVAKDRVYERRVDVSENCGTRGRCYLPDFTYSRHKTARRNIDSAVASVLTWANVLVRMATSTVNSRVLAKHAKETYGGK